MPGKLATPGGIGVGLIVAPKPRKTGFVAFGLLAAVLVPPDVGPEPKHPCASPAHILCHQERANIEPDSVVQVRVPADRLLGQGLPANEDVVGGLAFYDCDQLSLKVLRGAEALGSPGFVVADVVLLLANAVL